jgi:hypothetical protein
MPILYSFVDYLIGRNMGLYWPMLSPDISKEEQQQQYDRLYECESLPSKNEKFGTAFLFRNI